MKKCLWPHPSTELLNYNMMTLSDIYFGGDDYAPLISFEETDLAEKKQPKVDYSHFSGKYIKDSTEFFRLFNKEFPAANWKKENVLIISEIVTYKIGSLNSDSRCLGIARINNSTKIIVGHKHTFFGVCQGVEQQMELFSSQLLTYAITVPKDITEIINYTCYEGPACSDIP